MSFKVMEELGLAELQKINSVPSVKYFKEAVWRPGEFIFMYILGFVLGLFGGWLVRYADGMNLTKNIWFPIGFEIFWGIYTFLSVQLKDHILPNFGLP